MSQINVTIDGQQCAVAAGSTILEAAATQGVKIPTLCKIKELDPTANCRMCVTEVEGARTLLPACATRVGEGMVIQTKSEKVKASRKRSLELIYSRHAVDCHHCLRNGHSKCDDLDPMFCEMCFFCDCVRDGFCELQDLAREYKVDVLPFAVEPNNRRFDDSTNTIVRNGNKCINCRRCVEVCGQVQNIHNLVVANRGSDAKIVPVHGALLADSDCIQCGKCAEICPTGAISFKEHIDEILYQTHDYDTVTVAQISEDIVPGLAELFDIAPEEVELGRVVAGLKKIGVDYVFFENYAKALSLKEGEAQLTKKLGGKGKKKKPVILTESRAAVKFIERNFDELNGQLIAYPTSQQMFGAHIKDSFIAENDLGNKQVKLITLSDNTERTTEAYETGSVDYNISSRELYRIFLRTGVDLRIEYPANLCDAVSAEAAEEVTGVFSNIPWAIGTEPTCSDVEFGGKSLKLAVATNLGQATKLLEDVKQNSSEFDIIRIV